LAAPEITVLLDDLSRAQGEDRKRVFDRLMSIIYTDLRNRARQQLRGEKNWQTLQPTALVNEAYSRLVNYEMKFQNREHFMNVAASAMRRLIIEKARRSRAVKRGSGKAAESLQDLQVVDALVRDPAQLLDLDVAISTLKPEQIQLLELRYFAGLTMEETAAAMGMQTEAAKKRWLVIKTLLYDKLHSKDKDGRRSRAAQGRDSRRGD
jgi:RNA polymerase sigma-70 factor (ECF subfamily)